VIRGIDVSHYQGSVDWSALKAKHHLSFGAAKASEGTSFVDSQFARNWAGMKAAGLSRIAYHYATPSSSSARTQAGILVSLADPVPGDALCLDLEKSNLSQSQTNTWMRAFGDALRDLAPGVTTVAYLGGYAANGSGQSAVDHFDRWWYPRYASMSPATHWPVVYAPPVDRNTTGWAHPPAPHIWQWTPNLDGMDANVSDMTVTELFTGDDVPLIQAEIQAVADASASAVFGQLLTNAIDGTSQARFSTFITQTHKQASFANSNAAAALAILTGTDAAGQAAFFADLVAALPPSSGGAAPTAAEVASATVALFAQLLGGTS